MSEEVGESKWLWRTTAHAVAISPAQHKVNPSKVRLANGHWIARQQRAKLKEVVKFTWEICKQGNLSWIWIVRFLAALVLG
jgi:hypothetical protein